MNVAREQRQLASFEEGALTPLVRSSSHRHQSRRDLPSPPSSSRLRRHRSRPSRRYAAQLASTPAPVSGLLRAS